MVYLCNIAEVSRKAFAQYKKIKQEDIVAKKRSTQRRRKNPAKSASVARVHHRAKRRSGYRRKNPAKGFSSSGITETIIEAAAGASGFVISDYMTNWMGLKYTPLKSDTVSIKKQDGKDLYDVVDSGTTYTSLNTDTMISKGYLTKKILPNAGIPIAMGILAHNISGNRKSSKFIKAVGTGAIINGIVEFVQAVMTTIDKKNISKQLSGLGGLGNGGGYAPVSNDQLAIIAQQRAAEYRARTQTATAGLANFKKSVTNNGYGR